MLVYPSSMPVSNRARQVLADGLRHRRAVMGSRWRRLSAGEQALLALSIDRVGMASGYDRAFFSAKHKRHGLNVQALADPAGRLVWASPALPGARHDMGAGREHGLIDVA